MRGEHSGLCSVKQCSEYHLDTVAAVGLSLSVFDVECHPVTCRRTSFDVELRLENKPVLSQLLAFFVLHENHIDHSLIDEL